MRHDPLPYSGPDPPRRAKRSRQSPGETVGQTMKSPRIFVQVFSTYGSARHAQAHLRNKGGYLYLCWRDQGKVRNFYLGKRPPDSPTASSRPGAIATPGLPRSCRGKNARNKMASKTGQKAELRRRR